MTQRYLFRLEPSTGNIYGDGDALLGNADDWLRGEDEGKPWTKTEEYIESAFPENYEPVAKSKYYGFMSNTPSHSKSTLPMKPGEFNIADALTPSETSFSRPRVPSVITQTSFPSDVLVKKDDTLYITVGMSLPANVVMDNTNTYSSSYTWYNRIYVGNLNITEAVDHNTYGRHSRCYCPFGLRLYTGTGSGALLSHYNGNKGTPYYDCSTSGIKLKLFGHKDTSVVYPDIDMLTVEESRINIFSTTAITATENGSATRVYVKATTTYMTDAGVILGSFDWDGRLEKDTIEIGLPYDSGDFYTATNVIIPGIRLYAYSMSTEPVDISDVFPETYDHFLDGNGLATAWDITKTWVNKYKQDKLTAGTNITISDANVISATGADPEALTTAEVTDICNNVYGETE